MIFTALGMLVLAAALFIAGIAKSSVLLLMLSLVCTIGACVVLGMSYGIARRSGLISGGAPAMPAPAGGAPPGFDPNAGMVVMYVPVDQLPAMSPAGAAMKVGAASASSGNGAAVAAPVAGYDEMTADQVTKLVGSGALSESQLQALRDYEASHAGRKTVLDRIDRAL